MEAECELDLKIMWSRLRLRGRNRKMDDATFEQNNQWTIVGLLLALDDSIKFDQTTVEDC